MGREVAGVCIYEEECTRNCSLQASQNVTCRHCWQIQSPAPSPHSAHAHTHTCTSTHTHTHTHQSPPHSQHSANRHRHTDTQIHGHTDTWTHRLTDTQTHQSPAPCGISHELMKWGSTFQHTWVINSIDMLNESWTHDTCHELKKWAMNSICTCKKPPNSSRLLPVHTLQTHTHMHTHTHVHKHTHT